MRKRLYEIIEVAGEDDKLSNAYDLFMMDVILMSLIPLAFKEQTLWMQSIDKITLAIFTIDYILRLTTADFKMNKRKLSFLEYPFTFMAIIDLLAILPSILVINNSIKLLKVLRLLKSLRVFRAFKAFRYSKNITIIMQVFERQKDSLLIVAWFSAGYILLSALLVFNVEPETFSSFFDAVYWATISLTTMGYGDIYPVSDTGRIVTMLSSILGIAIVALPASIITAGYMTVVNDISDQKKNAK